MDIAITNYNLKMKVDPSDHIGMAIIKKGVFDEAGCDLITRLSPLLSGAALDVGANIGNHTLVMAKSFGRVVAIEPGKRNFDVLLENIKLNGFNHVKSYNVGLADKPERLKYYPNRSGNAGMSTFVEERSDGAECEHCEVLKGDDLLNGNDFSLIKLDVEGFELKVILGLFNTIRQSKPIVMMEWNDQNVKDGFSLDSIKELFSDYTIYGVLSSSRSQYWRGKFMWRLRRSIYRRLFTGRAALIPFNPGIDYENILLIPNRKVDAVKTVLLERL